MRNGLLLLFIISLTTQAKVVTKKYPTWAITCTVDHGQIVPNTSIIVSFGAQKDTYPKITYDDMYQLETAKRRNQFIHAYNEINGTYTDDGCIVCKVSSNTIDKIKFKIQNEEGVLNLKNKNTPQISVVDISLASNMKIRDREFVVTEDSSTYTLSSKEGINFSTTEKVIYPFSITGQPQGISIRISKDSLNNMYNSDIGDIVIQGHIPAMLLYENGYAEGLVSVSSFLIRIENAKLTLKSGELIQIDNSSVNNNYAVTTDDIKLLPGWYEKFKERTKPNEGETLTHYYHRAYTADSLYKVKQELEQKRLLAQREKEKLEREKREEERRRLYQEYEYPDGIIYFCPNPILDTGYFRTASHRVTYDKTNKYYNTSDGELRFAVDEKGYRKWDILYYENKPIFFNVYTWYVNGVIESIKSYHYNSQNIYNAQNIYVICHFFTDGELRSAYQYGSGNSNKNVLRKSKESHPTFGGYSCKQYDLNGKYERSISWKIGEEPYGLFIYKFAPNRLEFNKLKPVNN